MMDRIPHSSSLLNLRSSEKRSPPVASSVMTYLEGSQSQEHTLFWASFSYIDCCVSNAALMGRMFGCIVRIAGQERLHHALTWSNVLRRVAS
jgi:hypothetical protein